MKTRNYKPLTLEYLCIFDYCLSAKEVRKLYRSELNRQKLL